MEREFFVADLYRVAGIRAAVPADGGNRSRSVSRSTILPLPSSPHCRPTMESVAEVRRGACWVKASGGSKSIARRLMGVG